MSLIGHAVGKTVRKIRKERGLSQEVLSGLSDISRSYLAMIEAEKTGVSLETIWKISEALDMAPSDLIRQVEQHVSTTEKE